MIDFRHVRSTDQFLELRQLARERRKKKVGLGQGKERQVRSGQRREGQVRSGQGRKGRGRSHEEGRAGHGRAGNVKAIRSRVK